MALTTETYHILQVYANGESVKWFSEGTVEKAMQKRFTDLAGQIKIEMISTFKKIIKQKTSNNPAMQMRFNTKHAIGMAKQKTLKEQKNFPEVEEFLDELYEQAISSLRE